MMFRLKLLCTAAVLLSASTAVVAQTPRFLHKTADEWRAQLASAKATDRRKAAFALGQLGSYAGSALPALKQLYAKETDARTREAIVLAAGEIAAETASVDAALEAMLIDALQRDDDRLVRRSAAIALGMLGSKKDAVQTALGNALSEPEQVVRQNAAWALGRLGARAAPALVAALQDGSCDSLVKRDAANALFAVGSSEPSVMRPALDALLAMCQDKDPEVRKAGLTPLIKILGRKDDRAAATLKAVLGDPDAEVRRFAALALSNIGGKAAAEAVPVLIEALRNAEPQQKRDAAIAIHNIGESAAPAIPDLIRALQDPDQDLRKAAAVALGGIGKAAGPAVPALVKVLTDESLKADLRVQAGEAMAYMRDLPEIRKNVPELLRLLGNKHEDGNVRLRVVWIIMSFFENLQIMETAKPVMERVCAESGTKENGDARYQCAFLLAGRFQQKAPDTVLNVLQEWLYDNTGRIYAGVETKAGATGTERTDQSQSKQKLEDDSRVMAIQALDLIGRDRVAARKEIIDQLRVLDRDPMTLPSLRKDVRALLRKLNM